MENILRKLLLQKREAENKREQCLKGDRSIDGIQMCQDEITFQKKISEEFVKLIIKEYFAPMNFTLDEALITLMYAIENIKKHAYFTE